MRLFTKTVSLTSSTGFENFDSKGPPLGIVSSAIALLAAFLSPWANWRTKSLKGISVPSLRDMTVCSNFVLRCHHSSIKNRLARFCKTGSSRKSQRLTFVKGCIVSRSSELCGRRNLIRSLSIHRPMAMS